MIAQQTTWGDVWPFGYVSDRNGEVWKLAGEKSGWVRLVNAQGKTHDMVRPPDDAPVTAWLMTETEAFTVIYRHFPGAEVIAIERSSA